MIKKACLPAPPDCTEYGLLSDFYKRDDNSRVWWIDALEQKGALLFSFDRKKIYNYWPDYPCNLTPEEVKIFQEDEPYWANFRRASTAVPARDSMTEEEFNMMMGTGYKQAVEDISYPVEDVFEELKK